MITPVETSRRGGVRRGRKNEPGLIVGLHATVLKDTRSALKGLAGEKLSVGQVLDRLVANYLLRRERKASKMSGERSTISVLRQGGFQ